MKHWRNRANADYNGNEIERGVGLSKNDNLSFMRLSIVLW